MGQRYNIYMKEFMFLWVKAILLFALAAFFEIGMGNVTTLEVSYFIPLTIFGLSFFDRVVPFNLFGNHDFVIMFWVLKAGISFLIGIVAFPIVNIYYILKIIYSLFDKNIDEE